MKLLLLAASGLLILAGAHYTNDQGSEAGIRTSVETDPFTTGSISRASLDAGSARRYRVFIAGGGKGCMLAKGRTRSNGTAIVRVSPECATLYPGIKNAVIWRDEEGETVALKTVDGRTLLDLAAGDGVAYESYRPDAPLVSLVAD